MFSKELKKPQAGPEEPLAFPSASGNVVRRTLAGQRSALGVSSEVALQPVREVPATPPGRRTLHLWCVRTLAASRKAVKSSAGLGVLATSFPQPYNDR